MRKRILGITGAGSFLLALGLHLAAGRLAASLPDQQMAARWSEDGGVAQISCFFSSDSGTTEDTLLQFEHSLDSYLKEASIVQESENPSARLWADAYSAEGRIVLSSGGTNLEADAMGIGGDFFLFHPQKLLTGSYFSGHDLNHDYCIIDEDAAWQLFGSNDVAGMTVSIGGVPHIVSGVIRRPEGRMVKAAGLESTRVYVSLDTLTLYGTGMGSGINHYEIVMPNPVSGFALKYVQEQLGADEGETEVLENTTRYGLLNRLKVIRAFGTRSMNGKAIIYPYWENVARGYEDIIALITVFMMIFLLYAAGLALVFFILWWRHKSWTFQSIWNKIRDRLEDFRDKCYAAKADKEEKL